MGIIWGYYKRNPQTRNPFARNPDLYPRSSAFCEFIWGEVGFKRKFESQRKDLGMDLNNLVDKSGEANQKEEECRSVKFFLRLETSANKVASVWHRSSIFS
jgi:hypothetical protein